MKRFFIVSIFLMLFCFTPALAQETGIIADQLKEETKDDIVSDVGETADLPATDFIAENLVDLTGDYGNDVMAMGNEVNSEATVNGDLIITAGTVTVSGKVNGNLRVAGGTVVLEGEVTKNVTIAGGTISITDTAKIGRDLIVWGGVVEMNGLVDGQLNLSAGDVKINGQVNNNAELDSSNLTLGPNTKITGDLKYAVAEDPNISADAKIKGEVTRVATKAEAASAAEAEEAEETGTNWGSFFIWKLVWLVSWLLLGLVLVYSVPKCIENTGKAMFAKAGLSFLWGILFLIITPIVCVVLMITVIGLPLGILGLIAYGVSLFLSPVFLGIILGKKILPKQKHPAVPMLLGVTGIYILQLIPYVGGLVILVAMLWVLGAYLESLRKNKK